MTRSTPPSVAGLILGPAERAHALTRAVLDGPDLTGAACTGRAPLFDEQDPWETPEAYTARMDTARAVCRTCPVREKCAAVAAGLTDHQRAGVWAGDVLEHRETRAQRRLAERTDTRRAEQRAAARGPTAHPSESPTDDTPPTERINP